MREGHVINHYLQNRIRPQLESSKYALVIFTRLTGVPRALFPLLSRWTKRLPQLRRSLLLGLAARLGGAPPQSG